MDREVGSLLSRHLSLLDFAYMYTVSHRSGAPLGKLHPGASNFYDTHNAGPHLHTASSCLAQSLGLCPPCSAESGSSHPLPITWNHWPSRVVAGRCRRCSGGGAASLVPPQQKEQTELKKGPKHRTYQTIGKATPHGGRTLLAYTARHCSQETWCCLPDRW